MVGRSELLSGQAAYTPQVCPSQVGPAQIGVGEIGASQVDRNQASLRQVCASKRGPPRVAAVESDALQIGLLEDGVVCCNISKIRPAEICFSKACMRKISAPEIGIRHAR